MWIVKIGGSWINNPNLCKLIKHLQRLSQKENIIIVNGGGSFSDSVRLVYENQRMSEKTGNYIALKATELFSHLLKEIDDNIDVNSSEGAWVLIASALGLGKRVPVTQFRLQKRAGMGLRAIKFRIKDDVLVCLKVLGKGEELLFVTEKGVIVRTNADKISQQSRAATGVKLQRLDEGDHLSEVVLVPREQKEETDQMGSSEEN